MESTNKKFSTLKILLAVSLFALISTIGFSYKIYDEAQKTKEILISQKKDLLDDLINSKDSLEVAISENSTLKTELIIERQKVTNLLREISSLNTNDVDYELLLNYKKQVDNLKQTVVTLTKEKNELRKNNEMLKIQRDSTILVLTEAREKSDELAEMNKNLDRKIKSSSNISIVNLKTYAYKQSRSGDLEPTDKAKKANLLQISFIVVGTKTCKPSSKEYYVQIIDSKNNIVGDKKTKKFGPMVLDYSYLAQVNFKNESLEVSADLALEEAEKGMYWVNVYEKGNLASKTTFELK